MQKEIKVYLTSIFRTITGTRCKQEEGKLLVFHQHYNSRCSKPYNSSNCSNSPGHTRNHNSPSSGSFGCHNSFRLPATAVPPALTMTAATNLATITEIEHDLSVPETVLLTQLTTNESQLGASYLNNNIHHVVRNTSISMCSSNSHAQQNLKSLLDEKLNDKMYNTFEETFSNTI